MIDTVGDFEARAGRLTREVAENLAAPARDAGLTLIESAFHWLSRFTLGLLLKTVAAITAAIFLVVAVICGCTAGYLGLASLVGAAPACLIIALLFLALSAVMAAIAVHARMELRPEIDPVASPMRMAEGALRQPDVLDDAPMPPNAAVPNEAPPEQGLRGTAQALATVLGAAGLPRQKAGVEAGLVLAERLSPLQLAVIAAAAAFAEGRALKQRDSGPADGER